MLHEKLTANKIDIEDIAHGLSLQNRFNGHIAHPYSVAQHCLNAVGCAIEFHKEDDPNILLAILMHDCAEAYLGDIVRPLKYMYYDAFELGLKALRFSAASPARPAFTQSAFCGAHVQIQNALELEDNIEAAIYSHFRIPHFDPRASMLIQEIDTRLCATESLMLCAESMPPDITTYPIDEAAYKHYDFRYVKEKFLSTFYELVQQRSS